MGGSGSKWDFHEYRKEAVPKRMLIIPKTPQAPCSKTV